MIVVWDCFTSFYHFSSSSISISFTYVLFSVNFLCLIDRANLFCSAKLPDFFQRLYYSYYNHTTSEFCWTYSLVLPWVPKLEKVLSPAILSAEVFMIKAHLKKYKTGYTNEKLIQIELSKHRKIFLHKHNIYHCLLTN